MFDQKLLFKVMLWSLGCSAILGVAAVLTASFDVVGRILATTFLTSATAAFLWQASIRLEQNALAIKFAQTGVILFFISSLLAIWRIGDQERLWTNAFVCLGGSTVAASSLAIQRQAVYRYMGQLVFVASIVSTLCVLIGIWSQSMESKIALSGGAIACWSAAAAVCLVGLGLDPPRHWRWLGVAASLGGLLITEWAIIQHVSGKWIEDCLFVLGSVVVTVIHAVLCYASRAASGRLIIRTVAIISTIVTVLLVDIIVLGRLNGDQFLARLAVAAAIVASTSTIATSFIIQKLARQFGKDSETKVGLQKPSESAYNSIQLECPRCQQRVTVSVGQTVCPNCQLGFKIEILSDN